MQQEAPTELAAGGPAGDYRQLLDSERAELQSKLEEIGYSANGGVSGSGPSYDPNFADSSAVTAERGEAEALANKLRDTLDEVERALAKLEGGDYGSCEACGEPINPARLEAMPTARYCINCAGKSR